MAPWRLARTRPHVSNWSTNWRRLYYDTSGIMDTSDNRATLRVVRPDPMVLCQMRVLGEERDFVSYAGKSVTA